MAELNGWMVVKDDQLELLEEEIKENIEWLSTIDDDDIELSLIHISEPTRPY